MLPVSDIWLKKILDTLYEIREATRGELAEATGLNIGSISRGTRWLLQSRVIQTNGHLPAAAGRRPAGLRLNPEGGYFVSLDLEGTRIRMALTNFIGDIRYRWAIPVAAGSHFDDGFLARGLKSVLANLHGHERERVLALGVSYTGIMDAEGRVTASNLGWRDFPLKERIAAMTELPAFYGTESYVKLLAERWRGAARGSKDCVFVTVANGVGCAIMNDGKPLLGRDGAAGEIGHVVVDPAASDRCRCGNAGCLEAVASSPSIVRQYLAKAGSRPRKIFGEQVIDVFECARAGDPIALEVIERATRYLGLALANLANLVNPELIVLGGDIVYGEDLVLPRIRKQIARHALPAIRSRLGIKASALGLDAGLIGAASLAFHGAVQDSALLKRICSSRTAKHLG